MAENNEERVKTLMSMGFDREQSMGALNSSAGNLEYAIDALLSISTRGSGFGNGGGGRTLSSSNDVIRVRNTCSSNNAENGITETMTRAIHCNVSQYNNATGLNGRSACTAIALTMGCKVLTRMNDAKRTSMTTSTNATLLENIIDSDFLSISIQEGIRLHHSSLVHESGVEHASVEELLQTYSSSISNNDNSSNIFSSLRQFKNSPRQGILASASFGDISMGLEGTLCQCQIDATDQQSYIAVVITKPPETVLVLLPPSSLLLLSSSSSSSSSLPFVLLDSHPRPQQLSPHYPTGSYALYHSSLQALVASLHQILPAVELGSDVPEMMAMMYNSFDVYPFQFTFDQTRDS